MDFLSFSDMCLYLQLMVWRYRNNVQTAYSFASLIPGNERYLCPVCNLLFTFYRMHDRSLSFVIISCINACFLVAVVLI